jgi:hypothetical protein
VRAYSFLPDEAFDKHASLVGRDAWHVYPDSWDRDFHPGDLVAVDENGRLVHATRAQQLFGRVYSATEVIVRVDGVELENVSELTWS